MVSSKNLNERLIGAKVVALLHDPPHKLWVITRAFRGGSTGRVVGVKGGDDRVAGRGVAECNGLLHEVKDDIRAHEREARAVIQRVVVDGGLLEESDVDNYWDVASHADILASAFDRWPLPSESGSEEGGEVVPPEALVNPLNPAFKLRLGATPEPKNICNYIRELGGAVKDAYAKGGLTLAYHTLYALLEPLWYLSVGNYPSPADTRVPTHTVFDHLYASASMVNWVYPGGIKCGTLLHIDLAAVQEWISASRRTGDMWAASWLASALAWAAVRPLVEEYGPDLMLMPTARLNPFYLAWLYNELSEIGANRAADTLRGVLKKLDLLETILEELKTDSGYRLVPRHPVMPVTMTLVVPCMEDGCEYRLTEKVKDSFRSAWRELVVDLANNLSGGYNSLVDPIEDEPPLPLRIVVTRVCLEEEELKKFIRIASKATELAGGEANAEKRLLFPYALAMQARNARASKLATVRPGVAYSVELTKTAWSEGWRYDECTMCGVRPALPDVALEPLRMEGIVSEEEHLCPYCLVKRLAWHTRLLSIGKLIHSKMVALKRFKPRVPPVNVLASADAVAELCKLAGVECRQLKDLVRFLETMDHTYNKNKDIRRLRIEGKDVGSIYDVLEAYFRADTREAVVDKLAEVMSKLFNNVSRQSVAQAMEFSGRYYALIHADGDGVGDALWGRLGYHEEDAERYWHEVLSAIRDEKVKERVTPSLLAEAARSVSQAMSLVSQTSSKGKRVPVVVPTPAYLFALSMSLMASALIDSLIAETYWGIPVYAGGDDLVVLAPARSLAVAESILTTRDTSKTVEEKVYQVISPRLTLVKGLRLPVSSIVWTDIVVATRRWFWALDSVTPGFHMLGGSMPVAAPAGLGRSYAVLLSHYREPLRLKVDSARQLERYAKEASTNNGIAWKDSVAVGYGRGRAPELREIGLMRNARPESPLNLALRARSIVGLPVAVTAAITLLLASRGEGSIESRAEVLAKNYLKIAPVYSASLLYDLESSMREVEMVSVNKDLALLVLARVAERNLINVREDERENHARRVVRSIWEAASYWPRGPISGLGSFVRSLHVSRSTYS